MKILQHGNKYKKYSVSCPDCNCKFIFNITDVFQDDKYSKAYVYCPECDERINEDKWEEE